MTLDHAVFPHDPLSFPAIFVVPVRIIRVLPCAGLSVEHD
jgi:hypothetical protein